MEFQRTKSTKRNGFALLKMRWLLYFIFFVILPLRYKAHIANQFLIYHISLEGYGALQSVLHDSLIISAMLLLVYLSLLKKKLWFVNYPLRVSAAAIFLAYVADIFVIYHFTTHITLTDAIKYGPHTLGYLLQIYGTAGLLWIAMPGLAAALVVADLNNLVLATKRGHVVFGLLIVLLLSGYACRGTRHYIHSWVYDNFLEYNATIGSLSAEYSDAFIQKLPAPNETVACTSKKAGGKNIVVLMVESLSSFQSHHFSGIKNWTPHLDEIAQKNISFLNFYANGFNTEDGYIAALTGLFPIAAPAHHSDFGAIAFQGFENAGRSLPAIAKSHGYKTCFLSSGDMLLSGERQWARRIGFDSVEGSDHPFYQGMKRFHFDSVPDKALYDRALSVISQNKGGPYFLFLSTLSGHPPFINPESDNLSEEEVVRYVDREIGRFYRKLNQMGFFQSGILLITGDHRAMIPLKPKGIETFGAAVAPARIPLIVSYGDTARCVEKSAFQQTDIFSSVRNFISDKKCTSRWLGDFLTGPAIPPEFIVFKRGDQRNLISVFHAGRNMLVKLDGDATRIVAPADINENVADTIRNKVNYERIKRSTGK